MSRLLRRAVAAPVIAFLAAGSALAATASPALADDSSTLTVVGTSDVFDSNLVQSVIKPGFEAANPGITLNYVSKGTGAAIAYAEAGSASAMVVHAASLENQFVDQGYSLEQYGRAIFWGDYVLLGPANDPAKVLPYGANDIVSALEKVAAAGKAGKANFVSRGGTPGTTVQEHALWALTSGVKTCQVSSTNGGGTAPSTVSGPCTTGPTPTNPSWYHTTGLTQGPNIVNGDTCNYTGGGCYVFTDRGTYQYLKSQGSISTLQILVRNNATSRRGGLEALVNKFHAYGVNPDKFAGNPNVSINADGARKFLDYITSSAAQTAIGAYLASDPAGAPFIPDAQPIIKTSALPASRNAGQALTVTGIIKNKSPGTPALNDVPVTLNFTPTADSSQHVAVATANTDAGGNFTLTYTPTAAGRYTVTTGQISKIEDGSLDPVFGDLLSPATTPALGPVAVKASITTKDVVGGAGVVTGNTNLRPAVYWQNANLDLYAAPASDPDAALVYKGTKVVPFAAHPSTSLVRYALPAGTWRVAIHYRNPNVVTEAVSAETTVTVS